jgi:hypothetical protein
MGERIKKEWLEVIIWVSWWSSEARKGVRVRE